MSEQKKHIVWIIANNTTVPYFRWFSNELYRQKLTHIRFSVILLCKDPLPQLQKEIARNNHIVHSIYFNPEKRKLSWVKTLPKLYFLLKKLKPNIVHSHLFDDSLPSMLIAKLLKTPMRVVTKQDTAFHWYYAPKGVKYDRLINAWATHLIACSTECEKFILEKEKAQARKVVVIHHGIPTEVYAHPDLNFVSRFKQEHSLENKFVVGTVSRFIEWKGYKTIIEVAKILAPQIPNICFLLIGQGGQKEEIIALIKKNHLENHFCLPGYIQPGNMPSAYGLMNCYLHAAKMEPFGFVIAEAMAAGLPVVSTPTGAALDAIQTGENGWLAEYDKHEQLARHLMEVRDKNISIPWQPAKETARQHYNFNLMFNNYLFLYGIKPNM